MIILITSRTRASAHLCLISGAQLCAVCSLSCCYSPRGGGGERCDIAVKDKLWTNIRTGIIIFTGYRYSLSYVIVPIAFSVAFWDLPSNAATFTSCLSFPSS